MGSGIGEETIQDALHERGGLDNAGGRHQVGLDARFGSGIQQLPRGVKSQLENLVSFAACDWVV